MPILDNDVLRSILGGENEFTNGNDCVFQCMNWMYRSMSGQSVCSVNLIQSAYEVYEKKMLEHDGGGAAGVLPAYMSGFMGQMYDCVMVDKSDLYRDFEDYNGLMVTIKGGAYGGLDCIP